MNSISSIKLPRVVHLEHDLDSAGVAVQMSVQVFSVCVQAWMVHQDDREHQGFQGLLGHRDPLAFRGYEDVMGGMEWMGGMELMGPMDGPEWTDRMDGMEWMDRMDGMEWTDRMDRMDKMDGMGGMGRTAGTARMVSLCHGISVHGRT